MKKKEEQRIRDSISLEKFEHNMNRDFLITQHILLATYGFGTFAIIFGVITAFKESICIWAPISVGLFIIFFFGIRRKCAIEINRLNKKLICGECKIRNWYKQIEKS